MAPPSSLSIATQSVLRLVKEEAYYHKELEGQRARVTKREEEIRSGSGDQNAEYVLKQEQAAVAETEKVFKSLYQRISESVGKLEEQIALSESEGASGEELDKAKEAFKTGKQVADKAE